MKQIVIFTMKSNKNYSRAYKNYSEVSKANKKSLNFLSFVRCACQRYLENCDKQTWLVLTFVGPWVVVVVTDILTEIVF